MAVGLVERLFRVAVHTFDCNLSRVLDGAGLDKNSVSIEAGAVKEQLPARVTGSSSTGNVGDNNSTGAHLVK